MTRIQIRKIDGWWQFQCPFQGPYTQALVAAMTWPGAMRAAKICLTHCRPAGSSTSRHAGRRVYP